VIGTRCETCIRMSSSAKFSVPNRKVARSRVTHTFIALKKYDSTALVSCCQIVASVIELDSRNDIG
jgi:hypothetical protein